MTTHNIKGFEVPFKPTKRYFERVYIGLRASQISGLEKFEAPDPAEWCPRGYALVQPEARGIHHSEGDFHQFGTQEAQDGYDLVEWAGTQPWSNGNVALVGNSWLGIMQWFIAAEKPPHLKAIAPWEGAADFYRETLFRGGIPNTAFWPTLSTTMQGNGNYEDISAMMTKYPHMNAYWEDKNAKIANIEIPMYVVMSYSTNLHTEGSYRGWKYSSSRDKCNDELQRFLDRYLLVRVSLLRYNRPAIVHRPEDNYPPSRTQYHTLYLDSGNGSLSYECPKTPATASYTADSWDDEGSHFTYTFSKYTEILGPSKVKLFMSTKDKDDMDVYVIIHKLDVDGKDLLCLNVPLDQQPPGTVFENIDDMALYKYHGPTGRLRASKRALGQDPSLWEEQRNSQAPTELWRPYDQEEKVAAGTVVELDIPIWPAGMVFEAGESMRLEVKGHDHRLHEYENLHLMLKNLNVGTHTILLPLVF
ncbi:Alpha/Beta hydrolase protein [Leptodontidium sp. MPI-SDFR-AT-0119]|nr:Alpha/Beta hydrolase protein [Leptodontidium sp. MPI-SDFR-AT-0119]